MFARWMLAISVLLCMTAGAPVFADTASVTCKASDGTTHTYTASGSSCESYYDPNTQIKRADCGASVAQCKDGGAGLCTGPNCNISRQPAGKAGLKAAPSAGIAQPSSPQPKGKPVHAPGNVGGAAQ